MGFFDGLISSPKVSTPATGIFSQPEGYKTLYNHTVDASNNTLFPGGNLNTNMFQPVPQNANEVSAQGMINRGTAPTAQSLRSDISMLTNPFDQSVIDSINRESQGQNSLVNQAATQAGQQGSNRSFLGTSDVEQNRLNNIGMFRQNQYNTAINQALGPLAGLRQQDIGNNQVQGAFTRGLDTQTQQAPLAALQAAQAGLTGIPTQFGSSSRASSSGGGIDAGKVIGLASSFFSDRRLKNNIVHIGEENGFPIYEFTYKKIPDMRFIGVMAQDVQKTRPDAVAEINGYLAVNYDSIGVRMRAA